MVQSSKAAFRPATNEDNYRKWQEWQQTPQGQQPLGNEKAPGLRDTPTGAVPVDAHFRTATNQDSYNSFEPQRAQHFKAEPMAAPQKTTDDQPGAYPDPGEKDRYPGLPQSTDKGRVMDLEFDVTGSDGKTYTRSAKVYVPNEVADKMQENQRSGRDALDGVDVLMGFHGHGGSAENTLDGMDMAGLANRRGAILISPQGLGEKDPNAPIGPDNKSRWDLDGDNTPAYLKNLLPAAGERIGQEYGVDADIKEVDLIGMSMGANAVREISANPEKYLPEGTKIGSVTSVTASGDVVRDGHDPAQIDGTQLYIFGMQDQKAAEKILGDENAKRAYLDSLSKEERAAFRESDDKVAFALENRGKNDKIGEMMKDDYMGTVQAAAAAQGVTLTREDIEKTREDIYKPILDEKGNAVLGADGKPTYDTNTVLGSRYNIDVEQDGHKFKAEVNISNNMDHNWPHQGPSRLPGAMKDALKNDDDLEARYYASLSDAQKGEYDSLSDKERLDFAVNNDQNDILKGAVRKKDLETNGIDAIDRANEIMERDRKEREGPANDATLKPDQKPDAPTPQDPQQPDPSQEGRNGGGQRRLPEDESGGWAAVRKQNGPGLG